MIRLKCCKNRHDPILLPDGETITLGRCRETKIIEKGCSRQQVELKADYSNETVSIKHLGTNPSRVKGVDLKKGEVRTLKVGDTFNFVTDQYQYKIVKDENFKSSRSSMLQTKTIDKPSKSSTSQKRTIDAFFGASNRSEPAEKKKKVESDDDDSEEEREIAKKLELLKNTNLKRSKNNEIKPLIKNASLSSLEEKWEVSQTPSGWSEFKDLMLFHSPNLYNSSKIAGFDMDGTLITTASGRTFAVDHNDWKILYSEVPGKLKKLHAEHFKIVIITNQLGIGKGKIVPKNFKIKIENLLKKLGVPAQVIAITKRGPNRKPNLGSWDWLLKQGNGDIAINMKDSFYIGDAAGRPKDWAPKKKKDFSCTDRLYALNLGISFKTPEEFFLSQKTAKFDMPSFDPKSVTDSNDTDYDKLANVGQQEVILMVGYPASGKSFFSKRYFASKGYVCVNRDTMKTWQKCVAACNQALANGKSVIIDNTNPDKVSRKRYIDCAKSKGCPCHCLVMEVTMEHARHNNRFRELSGFEHDKVPDMVFYQYRKSYEEPNLSEGFDKITKVNFIPKFKDEAMKQKYYLYTD